MKMASKTHLNSTQLDAMICDLNTVGAQIVQETVKKTLNVWKVMYPQNDIREWKIRLKSLLDNIETSVTTVYEKEEDLKLQLIKEIEAKYKELELLQKELSVTINTDTIHPDEPLTVMSRLLDELLASHRQDKLERLEKLKELREKESELCALLDAEPMGGIPRVPSRADFDILEDRLRWLCQEKVSRTDRYNAVRAVVHNIMTELEEKPVTEFERIVFSSEPFHLSPSNMEKLEELQELYEKKLHDARAHIDLLKNNLQKLWIRIKEPPEDQANFLERNCGLGMSTIKAFNREIARAEAIKFANIKPVIEGLREDIASLWDHLTYTEEQRLHFDPFYCQYFSEEVMELHEIKLAELQTIASSCENVLKLAREREKLLERRAHLELLSKDKSRLNNRGGQLLREEKERKALDKKFPRLEEELVRLLTEYKTLNEKPFLFHGENLLEKIMDAHNENEQKKVPRTNGSATLRAAKRPIQHNGVTSVNSSRVITRSQTPRSDVSTASCASYTHFQSNLGEPTFATPKRMLMTVKTPSKIPRTPVATRTPGARTPLRPIQTSKPTSAYRATSSPRGTPRSRTNIPAPLSASRTPHRGFF